MLVFRVKPLQMCTFAQIFDVRLNKYYLAAFSAFVIWGFFSLALKPLHDYPSLDILFYRVFYATGLLVFLNFVFRNRLVRSNIQVFRELSITDKTRFLTTGYIEIKKEKAKIYEISNYKRKD